MVTLPRSQRIPGGVGVCAGLSGHALLLHSWRIDRNLHRIPSRQAMRRMIDVVSLSSFVTAMMRPVGHALCSGQTSFLTWEACSTLPPPLPTLLEIAISLPTDACMRMTWQLVGVPPGRRSHRRPQKALSCRAPLSLLRLRVWAQGRTQGRRNHAARQDRRRPPRARQLAHTHAVHTTGVSAPTQQTPRASASFFYSSLRWAPRA